MPDAKRGGVGPAGYAIVVDGKFDTRTDGRDPVLGPQLVRIVGFEKELPTIDEVLHGNPLFDPYETTVQIDSEQTALKFEIPATSAP